MLGCKIIATNFNKLRSIRDVAQYPDHAQDVSSWEKYAAMIDYSLGLEIEQEHNMPVDVIVVYNDIYDGDYLKIKEFFSKYDGQETKNGHIYVIYNHLNNGSFGGYDLAFQYFRDKYYWWMFSEDDVLIYGEDYYRKHIEKFVDRVGFVASIGIMRLEYPPHAHGGFGLTTINVLEKVVKRNNDHLPHLMPPYSRNKNIHHGEIPFTNEIEQLGYVLEELDPREWSQKEHCKPYLMLKDVY